MIARNPVPCQRHRSGGGSRASSRQCCSGIRGCETACSGLSSRCWAITQASTPGQQAVNPVKFCLPAGDELRPAAPQCLMYSSARCPGLSRRCSQPQSPESLLTAWAERTVSIPCVRWLTVLSKSGRLSSSRLSVPTTLGSPVPSLPLSVSEGWGQNFRS